MTTRAEAIRLLEKRRTRLLTRHYIEWGSVPPKGDEYNECFRRLTRLVGAINTTIERLDSAFLKGDSA